MGRRVGEHDNRDASDASLLMSLSSNRIFLLPHALMPPKKKLQLPSRAPSMIPQDDQPMTDATPTTETPATTPAVPTLQPDPWTDEQEISLFKGVVNWKPAGQ
ncbi:hypothetical protein GP486_003406 [Trichoglossum hirsutum]|uniref:Uncharacterized protein n=1 Tax=Trichoglossum hirsutum TaxID=265104 RepID=A0A9P8RR52_9PEZI|nr:hypothetical protein GP486_003406 [Trichoglossum hirsutum]